MPDIKRVCLIDPPQQVLINAFRDLGCKVLPLRTGDAPFFDLGQALDENKFEPDLVVQTETLGNRSLVTGLDRVDCPTIFWAVDPHLNAHWQARYARLFDLTCSTQRGWMPRLSAQGAEDVRWLPWYHRVEEWTPMAERRYDMAFVGRISGQRPARQWMVDFLKEKTRGFRLALEHSLSYGEMMALYADSRIIPNESIFGEINFRLFEAASCGCLVVSQDLGDEQAALFEPGREMDTYAHVVELDEKLARYLGNERLVQAMGRAARERLQAEHLPEHRVRTLLEYAGDAATRRATGRGAETWTGLTVAAMWEADLLPLDAPTVLDRLAGLEQTGEVLAAVLRVQAKAGMTRPLQANVHAILAGNLFPDDPEVNLAGSMAALRLDGFDAARAFRLRHVRATGGRIEQASEPAGLLTLWAKDLARRDLLIRAGFAFDSRIHLPATAGECLMTILRDRPEHLETLRLLNTLLLPVMGLEQARVGFLSVLTLHEREDWRLAFEIGLANLKSFRLDSGLQELTLARQLADKQGQIRLFEKALAVRDTSGLLEKRLG